jgi:ABC-type sugar transport system substrate-binding protein
MARILIGTLLLVIGAGARDPLGACGDKYLTLGLGTHYHLSAAERHAAAILIYATPNSELSKLLAALSVDDAMKKAGYQAIFASSSDQLDAALGARNWDVVVVDGADANAVSPRVAKASGAPHVLPVLTRSTKEELKRAEKIYDVVLNAPSRNRVFVDGVDDAMDVHAFEMAEAARAAKRSTR